MVFYKTLKDLCAARSGNCRISTLISLSVEPGHDYEPNPRVNQVTVMINRLEEATAAVKEIRKFFPNLKTLDFLMVNVYPVLASYGKNGWIHGVNDASAALEQFMRVDDTIEGVWLRLLGAPQLPVACFKGFRVDDNYLVKELSIGTKKLTVAIEVSIRGMQFATPW